MPLQNSQFHPSLVQEIINIIADAALDGEVGFGAGVRNFGTSVPMVVPSSGTMGNNGAVTLTTALPFTYSGGCYMYFPANAIVAGSAAGFYWTVMSSTTVGQVFNNLYITGVAPRIPGDALVPFVTTGPGAYTQAVTLIDALTYKLPANCMGNYGSLLFQPIYAFPNNANSKTLVVTLAGTQIYSKARTTSVAEYPLIDLHNRGVKTRQISAWSGNGIPAVASTVLPSAFSIDTSVEMTVLFRLQLAAATDYIILESNKMQVNQIN
jgi:hypothetical protein